MRTAILPLVAIASASLLAAAPFTTRPAASGAPACLDAIHGTWRGPGTILGRSIVMEQVWAPALNGAFSELRMRHLPTDTSTRAAFEGRGFYRAVGARAADSVHGSWHDSRG